MNLKNLHTSYHLVVPNMESLITLAAELTVLRCI